jgi:Anti-sigma-K factor rskA
MNGHPTNEEREALIAGDRALAPDEAADVELLAGLLGDPSTWAEPPAGLEDDVVRAVAGASVAGAVPAAGANVARQQSARRRRIWLPAVSAAAVTAIVVGGVFAVEAVPAVDFTARLSATAAAPTASASANFTKNQAGFRVKLDAHGLPTLPAGEYYQAWLKNAPGILVPIGTFSSSDGRITLWSGVSPKSFPFISVTIEAADGNQASSGRRVLTGEVQSR